MEPQEAINLIRPAFTSLSGAWADIGAGTGVFTEALFSILESGRIIAVDKNPHALYKLFDQEWIRRNTHENVAFEIMEVDFHDPLPLPPLDGILMANALHYAEDHLAVLQNVTSGLKPGGTFILVEYNTTKANPPWVPNPVPYALFDKLCSMANLSAPGIVNTKKSIYNDGEMYVARAIKD